MFAEPALWRALQLDASDGLDDHEALAAWLRAKAWLLRRVGAHVAALTLVWAKGHSTCAGDVLPLLTGHLRPAVLRELALQRGAFDCLPPLAPLRRFTRLRSLALECGYLPSQLGGLLAGLPELHSLQLCAMHVPSWRQAGADELDVLRGILACRQLTALRLRGLALSPEAAAQLPSALPLLVHLCLDPVGGSLRLPPPAAFPALRTYEVNQADTAAVQVCGGCGA